MIAANPKFKAADLFCGAGGFSTGAERSGHARVVLAVNHWRPAIYTHEKNHPHTRHVCASLDHVDPRDFEREGINLLLASPECIFHADARGARPIDDQRRSTAWCVPRWVEAIRPKWFVIENVKEFERWAPLGVDNRPLKSKRGEIFRAWIGALRACNYHVEWRLLNSADYGGATKRIRLFIVGRRGASQQPFRWPEPTHSPDKWEPAASIINWNLECPSIFERKRDLKAKTLDRIAVGIRKFCGPQLAGPFVVKMRGTSRTADIQLPLPTITAGGQHLALCKPFLTEYYGNGGARSVDEPLSTITTKHRHGLALIKLMEEMGIVDVGFRMLGVPELSAAMGFAPDYELFGSQADQVRQVGNAVHTHVAEAIVRAIGEAA